MQEATKDCIEPAIKDWLGATPAALIALGTNEGETMITEAGDAIVLE